MAKVSMKQRELRRTRTVAKFAVVRKKLKEAMFNLDLPEEERLLARNKFRALPRDASPVRQRNRCSITGRPHGFYRKFGLCRNKLREAAMAGEVPGIRKASW